MGAAMDEPDWGIQAGERGNGKAMKSRKTNLDTLEPDLANPEAQQPMARRPHKDIRLDREAQHRIGELLRSMYNTYVDQGVPQHLAELVRRIGEGAHE
jgi:hypothetical protein